MNQIRIVGPKDKVESNEKRIVVNVTSTSKTWTKVFSPFFLGPVKLYGAYGAWNVENAWQYSKVYECHADKENNPTEKYWKWALEGWANKRAVRYPMGRGRVPQYALWEGKRLGYIEARKKIFIPLYEQAVIDSGYFEALCNFVQDCWREGQEVCFWDFDGYDYIKMGMTLDECLDLSTRKFGHGFVLARMVERALKDSE